MDADEYRKEQDEIFSQIEERELLIKQQRESVARVLVLELGISKAAAEQAASRWTPGMSIYAFVDNLRQFSDDEPK